MARRGDGRAGLMALIVSSSFAPDERRTVPQACAKAGAPFDFAWAPTGRRLGAESSSKLRRGSRAGIAGADGRTAPGVVHTGAEFLSSPGDKAPCPNLAPGAFPTTAPRSDSRHTGPEAGYPRYEQPIGSPHGFILPKTGRNLSIEGESEFYPRSSAPCFHPPISINSYS